MMVRYSIFGAYLIELEELCKVKPATLCTSQEPQRGFHNLWLHRGCALSRSGLALALGGLGRLPRR